MDSERRMLVEPLNGQGSPDHGVNNCTGFTRVGSYAGSINMSALPGQGEAVNVMSPEIHWQFARTELANERTMLAWVRTSLSLFGIGFGILKVEKANTPDDIEWYDGLVGFMFMFCAVLCLFVGFQRYYSVDTGLQRTVGLVKQFDRVNVSYIIAAVIAVLAASIARTVACLVI